MYVLREGRKNPSIEAKKRVLLLTERGSIIIKLMGGGRKGECSTGGVLNWRQGGEEHFHRKRNSFTRAKRELRWTEKKRTEREHRLMRPSHFVWKKKRKKECDLSGHLRGREKGGGRFLYRKKEDVYHNFSPHDAGREKKSISIHPTAEKRRTHAYPTGKEGIRDSPSGEKAVNSPKGGESFR